MLKEIQKSLRVAGAFAALTFVTLPAAADLPPDVQAKVDSFKAKLQEWAAHPVIIAAVKDSNAAGGSIHGMTNAKWDELGDADPMVKSFQTNEAGALILTWEADPGISKLYLRDASGNLVACSQSKPLLYNNKTKPPFLNGLKGPWSASEIKPDPGSQVKGVHIAVPVLDGATTIGVLHSSVVAQ